MWFSRIGRIAVMCAGLAILGVASPAGAQAPPPPVAVVPPPPPGAVPPPSPEGADIAACLCLRQSVDALGADMNARRGAYEASVSEVGALDAQLQSARTRLDVNNPQAVAQFRQLLERRDAAFRRSNGADVAAYSGAVERHNARVNEFNARCADRPRNPVLVTQVQATLTCPPPY